jgi:hypothetical protein
MFEETLGCRARCVYKKKINRVWAAHAWFVRSDGSADGQARSKV